MMARHPRQQSGMVTLIAVVILLSVIAVLAMLSLQITGSGMSDTTQQGRSVQALMLAESGLETAVRRLQLGLAACDATLADTQAFGQGRYGVATGLTTDFDGATALPGTQCRIRSTGIVQIAGADDVSRTVEAVVETSSGAGSAIQYDGMVRRRRGNASTLTWSHAVDAGGLGNTILLVVVSNRGNTTVSSVTYRGTPLNFLCTVVSTTNPVRASVYYLLGAADGPGIDPVVLTLSGSTSWVAGSIAFTGVRQAVPPVCGTNNIDISAWAFLPNAAVTTSAANSYVVDVVARRTGNTLTPWSGQTSLWDLSAGNGANRIRGAAAYLSIPVAGSYTHFWSWDFANPAWSMAMVAMEPQPGGNAGVLRWREIARP